MKKTLAGCSAHGNRAAGVTLLIATCAVGMIGLMSLPDLRLKMLGAVMVILTLIFSPKLLFKCYTYIVEMTDTGIDLVVIESYLRDRRTVCRIGIDDIKEISALPARSKRRPGRPHTSYDYSPALCSGLRYVVLVAEGTDDRCCEMTISPSADFAKYLCNVIYGSGKTE